MTPDLHVLLAYHLGELDPQAQAEVEEQVFADAATARRLEAVVRTGDALRALVRAGRVTASLTARALDRLREGGITIHTYVAKPGEVVPCGPVPADIVVTRLSGEFTGEVADVDMETRDAAGVTRVVRRTGVPVSNREILLAQPGAEIRALPRCWVRIVVRGDAGERVFELDHDPERGPRP
jgi:hypothetical protein